MLDELKFKASVSERRRTNLNFHMEASDTLQRMLNVLNKDTYVKPHKHENPDKREAFIILEGKVAVIEFNEGGEIINYTILNRGMGVYACEIAPKTWHTIICLEDNSILYELKDGPYDASTDKTFAKWAPDEGSESAPEYNKTLLDKIQATDSILH